MVGLSATDAWSRAASVDDEKKCMPNWGAPGCGKSGNVSGQSTMRGRPPRRGTSHRALERAYGSPSLSGRQTPPWVLRRASSLIRSRGRRGAYMPTQGVLDAPILSQDPNHHGWGLATTRWALAMTTGTNPSGLPVGSVH